MEGNDYNLKWNDFEHGITSGIQDIYKSRELFDVTLVCGAKPIKAHKVILSACSPVFRSILNSVSEVNPVVYLRGVSWESLNSTISFMYSGEVLVSQEKLGDFLATAEDLQVSGLTPSTSGQTTNKPSSVPAAVPSRSSQTKPSGGGHQTKPSGGHQTKPKTANSTNNSQSQNKSKLDAAAAKCASADAAGSKRKAVNDDGNMKVKVIKTDVDESPQEDVIQTETILNDDDDANAYEEEFIPEESEDHPVDNFVNVEEDLGDYYDESFDEFAEMENGNEMVVDPSFDNSSIMDNYGWKTGMTFKGQGGVRIKKDRLPVVRFNNLNKIKTENGFMCKLCSKVSTDNSNMNRHIEIKHAKELQTFLQTISE